jgi:hypothetical protein
MRWIRRFRRALAPALGCALAVGAGWTGCATAGQGALGEEEEPVVRELTLHVRNDNFYDATLYAVSESGYRMRLGVARGLNRETFKFRWPYQDLRMQIDLLAAGASLSESLPVSEGDELELTITPDAHRR